MNKLMIITDLDGSLLDTESYRWNEAQKWLDYFREEDIPVVFCTSKTQAEVLVLQQAMQLEDMPYICENGALLAVDQQIYLPSQCPKPLTYQQMTARLIAIKSQTQFRFTGFQEATIQQLIQWTGLSTESAEYAKQRQASEPIYWQDTVQNLQAFKQCLAEQHLDLIQGGRFWHVMNQGSDKQLALAYLRQHYRNQQQDFQCIGLGDSPNDLLFLQHTEYSIVIRSKNSDLMQFSPDKQVYFTQASATQGWAEGLDFLIPRLNNNHKE